MKNILLSVLTLTAVAQPSFKIDVKLVRVVTTVKDQSGQLVGSLAKEQFRLWDSGVPQEIAIFERSTSQPLSVAMLIDASGSTAKDLPSEVASIRVFLKALLREGNPDDTASLYAFNYEVRQIVPFTRREGRFDNALKGLRGEAGTSLYDAVRFAAADLEMREGRKVIIIVTDGGDTTSGNTFRDALKSAHLAEAVIYPIVVLPIRNDAGRNIGGENALSSLAFGTGGRVFQASLGAALDQAFSAVLADLRTQYLLGYYPKNLPRDSGPFHELRIQILENGEISPKLRAFARSGYYEDSILRSSPKRPN